VSGVVFNDFPTEVIGVCTQADPHADLLEVHVVNNRPYSQLLLSEHPFFTAEVEPDGIAQAVSQGAGDRLTVRHAPDRLLFLPPLARATLKFDRPSDGLRYFQVTAGVTVETYTIDMVLDILQNLALPLEVLWTVMECGDLALLLRSAPPPDASGLGQLTANVANCFAQLGADDDVVLTPAVEDLVSSGILTSQQYGRMRAVAPVFRALAAGRYLNKLLDLGVDTRLLTGQASIGISTEPMAALCAAVTIARHLDERLESVAMDECDGEWATISDPQELGDTERLLQHVEERWTVVTGFPSSLCRDDVLDMGAPDFAVEHFNACAETASPPAVPVADCSGSSLDGAALTFVINPDATSCPVVIDRWHQYEAWTGPVAGSSGSVEFDDGWICASTPGAVFQATGEVGSCSDPSGSRVFTVFENR